MNKNVVAIIVSILVGVLLEIFIISVAIAGGLAGGSGPILFLIIGSLIVIAVATLVSWFISRNWKSAGLTFFIVLGFGVLAIFFLV